MSHLIIRVTGFDVVGPHRLAVRFSDDTEQEIDFLPVLAGPMFGPLQDPAFFKRVNVDPDAGTLVWPNGADFDPSTLHDWPNVREELVSRAQRWGPRLPGSRAAG